MPRKKKAYRQLASARVNATAAKIARKNTDHASDVEFLDNISSDAASIVDDRNEDEEIDSSFFIDGIHWRILPDEPCDSQHNDDEDRMNNDLQDDQVALRLVKSIKVKWRAVGDNFGYHGTSSSVRDPHPKQLMESITQFKSSVVIYDGLKNSSLQRQMKL